MRLTNNSLATTIGWVSTCLLVGGAGALFSESAREMAMIWGSFGLAAAVGLDITARVRERMRTNRLNVNAARRFDRDMQHETVAKEADADIREAVARILGRTPRALQNSASLRTQARYPCDLGVELISHQGAQGSAEIQDTCIRLARITNLSGSGFELMLTEPLPHRRMTMIIAVANGGRQRMFGEVLWYGPQEAGSIVAGGRFLDAVLVDDS